MLLIRYEYFIPYNCLKKKKFDGRTTKKKKNLNKNVQRTQFPNFYTENNPRRFEKTLKSFSLYGLVLNARIMNCETLHRKYNSEFESHWVPLSYGLVPHLSKKA